jgi:peptide/nickel transport system ATP-binding protein
MVFQEPMTALNPLMSIGQQVAETVRLHRRASPREALDVARATLDAVGLSGEAGALDRLPFELSGGQRQRVAIAIAIALSPPLLIADEPTTALDVVAQAQVLQLLKDFTVQRQMGLILVSHDLAVVAQLAHRVAVMQAGEIVEQGSVQDVLNRARHPYTQALIRAASLPARPVSRPSRAAPVLEVEHIVKEYRQRRRRLFKPATVVRALDDVSVQVHPGETVGLVGESGSGKSTLLKVILALQTPRHGSVQIIGEPFYCGGGSRLHRLRREVQAVFQDPYGSLDRRWSVERLIAEPFHLLDSPPGAGERRRRVAEVLGQVGLRSDDAHKYPHEFSGGQRQRIAIARALITQPKLIVFDEAVSALDVLVRQQILQLLQELAERLRLAYLFVTHDLHVVRAIADRVYVMQRGRIVEEGETGAVFDAPRHDYTRALIAATPTLPR